MVELVRDRRKIAAQGLVTCQPRLFVEPPPIEELSSACIEEHLLFERFMCWWNQYLRSGKKLAEPERHFTFFKLWDAFEQKECPICYLCRKTRNLYLSNLWYEHVNDVGLRNQLHRSVGFCPDATDASLAMGDDLGMSIIYRSLSDDIAKRLHSHESVLPAERCPVADHVEKMNHIYVRTLAEHYVAQDLQDLHKTSFGLCLQHIHEVMRALPDPELRKAFSEIEEGKFRELRQELDTFISKTDYLNKEQVGPERDAWIRAARKFYRLEPNSP